MVMMGMSNDQPARFKLTRLGIDIVDKAAIMYFIFFAVGAFTGLIIAVGTGGGKSSSSSKSK
jgi:hypothetical protein